MRINILLSLLLVSVFVAGCATHRGASDSFAEVAPEPRLLDTYWQLVELNGEPFFSALGHEREPHILFQELDQRVFGSGGCNRFFGGFELMDGDRIRLSRLASTMMACPNLDQEQTYLRALEATRTFAISQNKLSFKDASGKAVARFQAVAIAESEE